LRTGLRQWFLSAWRDAQLNPSARCGEADNADVDGVVVGTNEARWLTHLAAALAAGTVVDGPPEDESATDDQSRKDDLPGSVIRDLLIRKDLDADPRGLRIDGIAITGPLDLQNLVIPFPLHLTRCRLDGVLDLSGGGTPELCLNDSHTKNVSIHQAVIGGSIHAEGAIVAGGVNAHGVRVDGQVDLRGAELTNATGDALNLENAVIRGGVFANSGFQGHGVIRATGAEIGGQLNLASATITGHRGRAAILDNAEVGGDLMMKGAAFSGAVLAERIRVKGVVDLGDASVLNPDGDSVVIDNADIAASVHAARLVAEGTVRGIGTRVGGELHLEGAHITRLRTRASDGAPLESVALNLDTATIDRGLFLRDDFSPTAPVRLNHATVGGQTVLGFDSAGGIVRAVSAEHASFDQLVIAPSGLEGTLNLAGARIGDLVTPDEGLPSARLIATGWQVDDVHGAIRTSADAGRWLRTDDQAGKATQPWHALAAVYDRNGDPSGAKQLRFAAANQATRQSPWWARIGRVAYLLLTGHGYYPLVAGAWLALTVALGGLVVTHNEGDIVSSKPVAMQSSSAGSSSPATAAPAQVLSASSPCESHPSYPCFSATAFTLNALVPFAGLVTDDWRMRSDGTLWLTVGLPVLKVFAWALAAVLLAGVTGLLKRN
jgi:cytoskeletal protein CcmA (bactofilin family)